MLAHTYLPCRIKKEEPGGLPWQECGASDRTRRNQHRVNIFSKAIIWWEICGMWLNENAVKMWDPNAVSR